MFAHQDAQGPVEVAFTDRHRDLGGGPRSSGSLDLSSRGGTQGGPTNVDVVSRALARGREDPDEPLSLAPDVPPPRVVLMRQVHGTGVAVVDEGLMDRHEIPVADALVTRLPGVVLLVRVADCVPVLLADPVAGVVAAVHAGRPGLVAGVVPEAVAAMRAVGARSVRAWMGPHVCGGCYEVPAPMQEEVARVVPEARAETSWGTPSVDIGAGVLAQLRHQGVAPVRRVPRCTVEDDDLFSYRRQGSAAGRSGGLVWLRS